jgi:hypothetical protein
MSGTAEWQILQAEDLLREIAARNGQSLNASAIGRRLDLSCHAVRYRIAALEKAGMIRVLPSLAGRRPHVLLRDGRLLQELGAGRLAVMRTFLTERIATTLSGSCHYQWEAGRVKRIDLVVATSQESIGFLFTERTILRNRDLVPLRLGFERKVVDRGFLIYCGAYASVAARMILVLPIEEFLCNVEQWPACRSFREARELLRRRNCCAPFFSIINTIYPWRGCT